jgi:hypothetical protein
MSYYEESVAGLQQIMDALVGQATNAAPIEVDEMQIGQQQIVDEMAEMQNLGKNASLQGLEAVKAFQPAKKNASPWETPAWAANPFIK